MMVSASPNTGWARLDVTVDSGSATSCIPKSMVKPEMIQPCKEGPKHYTTASNHQVSVVGIIRPRIKFQNGVVGRVEMKVLDGLKKPLFSTARMSRAGYDITHTAEGSHALHRSTGHAYKIYERGGVFVMPVWMEQSFFVGQVRP